MVITRPSYYTDHLYTRIGSVRDHLLITVSPTVSESHTKSKFCSISYLIFVEDLNISIGVNFCTLGITLLMIYGAVRGKSLYLMPFFCLQAFDFFVTR